MQLIDANKARQGLTITARNQTGGRGQRGRVWLDMPGQSLLMSIIILPVREIQEQFAFNASIATAVANVLQNTSRNWQVHVKWPNDIIVNDKKAGGILIENVLRGSKWTHSVVGLGLNVKQEHFPDTLPFATSLKLALGENIDMVRLRNDIREAILMCATTPPPAGKAMEEYNARLYRRGQKQAFSDTSGRWSATIIGAHNDGTLELKREDGTTATYQHGQAEWVWESVDVK